MQFETTAAPGFNPASAGAHADHFMQILAHELRGPVAPIRFAAALIRSEKLDRTLARQAADIIERQVSALEHLINDVLEASRLRLSKLPVRRTSTRLWDIIANVAEITGPAVTAHGHTLVIDMPDESIQMDADPARLGQVLQNLVCNAAKYTDAGGTIRVCVRLEENCVVIKVRDDGMGIASADLDSIFDLHTRTPSATQRCTEGLGIGLFVAREIIEAHGGTLAAASGGSGMGSVFTVRLPRV
jgi:signal transduction histidine kinase